MNIVTWAEVESRINDHPLKSAQWLSDQNSLLLIADCAKNWDLDPRLFMEPSISNLRTIIREAKLAMRSQDRKRLVEIMEWANTLTVSNLRLKLGTTQPVEIEARKVIIEKEEYYVVQLTKEQFDQIQNTMKLMYNFKIGN